MRTKKEIIAELMQLVKDHPEIYEPLKAKAADLLAAQKAQEERN